MTAVALQCPKCSGPMWDETQSKYYKPGKPIAKCKDKACTGVLWAPKTNGSARAEFEETGAPPRTVAAPALTHGQMVTESLDKLIGLYDLCFSHALSLAKRASGPDTVVTLEGVSAIAATIFISAKEKGLV